jgi:hypothetical protein
LALAVRRRRVALVVSARHHFQHFGGIDRFVQLVGQHAAATVVTHGHENGSKG